MAIRTYAKSVKSYSSWQALTEYILTDYRVSTTDNGMCYECTTAGTSDSIEPPWPNVAGQTVADGSVVWTCREKAGAANPLNLVLALGDTGGFTLRDIWVKSDAEAAFLIWGSYDGVNWRYMDTLSVPDGERDNNHKSFFTAYPSIGVGTSTSAINEIEIVAEG